MYPVNVSYWRLCLTGLVIGVGFGGVMYRHAYLAVDNQAFLLNKSQERTERSMSMMAEKGQMVDRQGYPLAVSMSSYRLAVDPTRWVLPNEQKKAFAAVIDMPVSTLEKKLQQPRQYVKLVDRLTEAQVQKLRQFPQEGLMLETLRGRYYPMGESMAPIVGYVDLEGKGQLGVEYQFDQYIDGYDGKMSYTKNRLGQITQVHHYDVPIAGQQLQLTLDYRLQSLSYEVLKEAVAYYDADAASVVVLGSKTGEVLAMVNYPSFDPNQPIAKLGEHTKNHVISDLFEPGSIIKPIALAAVLQHKDHEPSEQIDASSGEYLYEGHVFHDHKDLGVVAFEDVLLKSSNIGMVKLTQMLPPQRLIQTYGQFGIFTPTFIQLPGEAVGRHVFEPTLVDEAAMSYGYGLSVNLLGIAHAYNILANDGRDPGVHLVFEKHRPESEVIIKPHIAQQINTMMVRVTEQGLGSRQAAIKGVSVAGKSGTSHLLGDMGGYENTYVSTFAGFAPADDPDVVVVVMVNKPKRHGHYGGQVAAPIFAKVLRHALNYLPRDSLPT